MQSPSTTAKFLKVTYVLFIKGGFLEGKRLQCHVISYSDRGLASKMYFLVVCSEKGRFVWGLLVWLRSALFHGAAHHFSDIFQMFRHYWWFSYFCTSPVSKQEFRRLGCICLTAFKMLFYMIVPGECE